MTSQSQAQQIELRQGGLMARNQLGGPHSGNSRRTRLRYKIDKMSRFQRLSPNAKE